ncbi:uncharacterized protein CC84DRAFT_453686 [Paraphaeosphaeria sporulosa]|uniref:G-protein coupled receptors family 1 profile domain-containing protein n=1 Tax=Paraphaeosphaeria sporulosa TaxID=1460663 RepID=A0A177CQK6_9PLEO|nr:uncharacterized protein CC84DRAFT_453686 [Paraphaeosphaeria sporulosa]OAG09804.1 hypothetical protein CC84DRAFT_453686 [Paraphaeosphaeria sporulosa]
MDSFERLMVCAILLMAASTTAAAPHSRHHALLYAAKQAHARDERVVMTDPETGRKFMPGETSRARTVYTVVALFCAVVLALLFGLRAKSLARNIKKRNNLTSAILSFLFLFAICFIFATAVVESGQSLASSNLCYSAIIICLVFYTTNKLAIYIFLLERARIVRAPFMRRHRDWLWISGMIIICAGFGTVAIIGFVFPVSELSRLDGRCRIGLPRKVAFPLMCFDIGLNFLLTGLFIWLLRPVLSLHRVNLIPGLLTKTSHREENASSEVSLRYSRPHMHNLNHIIKNLLWKCLVGSTLVMLPTVGNMVTFYVMRGRELGWICLTICTLDVSWGVLIINWLTIGSAQADRALTTLMSQQIVSEPDNERDGPVPATIMQSRLSGLGKPPPPAKLHDEGQLLAFDRVSSVPKQ